jgi:hypothetical protein
LHECPLSVFYSWLHCRLYEQGIPCITPRAYNQRMNEAARLVHAARAAAGMN